MSFFEKLKEKWEIKSNFQLAVILIVFSITGSLSIYITKPLLDLTGITSTNMNIWIYIPTKIAIVFPIYQVLIIIIGSLFGQFKFFWNFEKKILGKLGFKYFKEK